MSFQEKYGTMIDNAFGFYYDAFRKKGAVSRETALTVEELFDGNKLSMADRQLFQKMVSFGVVKKADKKRYWLDEGKAANPGRVLWQRMVLAGIVAAFVLAYCVINSAA